MQNGNYLEQNIHLHKVNYFDNKTNQRVAEENNHCQRKRRNVSKKVDIER